MLYNFPFLFVFLEMCDNQPIMHCGAGATGCSGSILRPICQCDTTGYVLAGDQHSCKLGMYNRCHERYHVRQMFRKRQEYINNRGVLCILLNIYDEWSFQI